MSNETSKIYHHQLIDTHIRRSLIAILCIYLCCISQTTLAEILLSGDVTPSDTTTWTDSTGVIIGETGDGSLSITNGSSLSIASTTIAYNPNATGTVTVNGIDSTLFSAVNSIGDEGTGTLEITNGGHALSILTDLGYAVGSSGKINISNTSSVLYTLILSVGNQGNGIINISDNGLVRCDCLFIGPNGTINMSTGGMLAICGQGDNTIADFLDMIDDADTINYYDQTTLQWTNIANATAGQDYTLEYITDGSDLDGFTVLTVNTVPEPVTLAFLSLGGLAIRRRK